MPELPDITIYIEALKSRIEGRRLTRVELKNPFLLRTVEPSLQSCAGRTVVGFRRVGKRIAMQFDGDLWLVLHLMIAGRLHWRDHSARSRGRPALLALHFENGTVTLTEAGTKRRASLHVLAGESQLNELDRGGLEVLTAELQTFVERMTRSNHTLKRALTDPGILSGIGNAYSDEILFQAKLSPLLQTKNLAADEWKRLFDATRAALTEWVERLRNEASGEFPEGVTAFREHMSVHGRFQKPCRVCGTSIQRIRYADNETNYCPRCQTGGKLLADRALSRLLKDDWPKTIEMLENKRVP